MTIARTLLLGGMLALALLSYLAVTMMFIIQFTLYLVLR